MRIRRPEAGDWPQVVRLAADMHMETEFRRYRFSIEKVEQLYEALLADDKNFFACVAEVRDDLIGFMAGFVCEHFFSTDKYASEMLFYVSPNWRGSTAALRMVRAYEAWAQDTDALDIMAGVSSGVQVDRTARFYEHLGYTSKVPTFRKCIERLPLPDQS